MPYGPVKAHFSDKDRPSAEHLVTHKTSIPRDRSKNRASCEKTSGFFLKFVQCPRCDCIETALKYVSRIRRTLQRCGRTNQKQTRPPSPK